MHLIQGIDIETSRWIDGSFYKKLLCGQYVLIWICLTGEHVRMTIHGVPMCSRSLSPSAFSISPTLLSDKKIGLCANNKLHQAAVHSFSNLAFTLPVFCFPACSLSLSQRSGSFTGCIYLQEEHYREKAPWQSHPAYFLFFSPAGFATSERKAFFPRFFKIVQLCWRQRDRLLLVTWSWMFGAADVLYAVFGHISLQRSLF